MLRVTNGKNLICSVKLYQDFLKYLFFKTISTFLRGFLEIKQHLNLTWEIGVHLFSLFHPE